LPSRSNLHFEFLTLGHSGAQGWAPEWPNVRNSKCRLDHTFHTTLDPIRETRVAKPRQMIGVELLLVSSITVIL